MLKIFKCVLENQLTMLNISLYRTVLVLITLNSMLNVIQMTEGRFLWDLSSYCINYCSRLNNDQMARIGVCSCHRIMSYYRRMAPNSPQTISEQD